MEDLCEKIDKVLVQFMYTLTDLYKEQHRLEKSMKAGYLNMSRARNFMHKICHYPRFHGESMKAWYLNMSRARYNMGIRSVGIQQCDENKMDAHVKVNVEDNLFNLENVSDLESQLSDLDIDGDGKGDSDKSGLRKRTVQREDNSPNVSSEKDSIQEINLKYIKKAGPFDPLKWFGVLVPQALRQSQSEFKSSVETAVSVANLKTKLVNLQNEYNDLLLQKKSMGE